jgi:hypothetical protein
MKKFFFGYFVALVGVLFLSACAPAEHIQGNAPHTVGYNDLFYFKDTRTNLCFAVVDNRYDTLTSVPCTPEVEVLLKIRK